MRRKRHLLSYLAGIFDGEGSVSIIRYRRKQPDEDSVFYYNLRVEMQMTEELIPRLFQNTFGGSIYRQKNKGENRKVSYKWYCASENARGFLMDILPFTILKSPQIEVALHFACDMGFHQCGKRLSNSQRLLREVDYILARKLKE